MLQLLRPAALAGMVVLCAAASDAPTAPQPAAPSTAATPPPAASAPPAKPPATAPAAAAKPPNPTLPTEEVDEDKVVALLGLAVNAADTKEVGRIVDLLVDGHGRTRAAVLDVGGFLGVGNRRVAVAWEAVRIVLGKSPAALLSMSSDKLKSAPAYDPAKPVEAVEAPPPPAPAKQPAPAKPAAAPAPTPPPPAKGP